jgi:hypothetical protein
VKVTDPDQRILEKVRDTIGADQLANSIVYLDRNSWQAGERKQVGGVLMDVPWDANIVFVDLEPKANWGHKCCYLAIRQDADDIIQVAAQMPPFLKAETSTFRFLWRGPLAPEWAVVTGPD